MPANSGLSSTYNINFIITWSWIQTEHTHVLARTKATQSNQHIIIDL